jgi:hypothetical protein
MEVWLVNVIQIEEQVQHEVFAAVKAQLTHAPSPADCLPEAATQQC